MADYAKMKNAELEGLLKERNLPHTGKKAELVKRLQDSDATPNGSADAAPKALEDEIDWDDEPAANAAANATTESAATAIAAGGTGPAANPQAVPNQVADIDPAKTDDLSVAAPAGESIATTETLKEKTPVDFSSGMATTTLDQEIEKRKARAKKFGMEESSDEALKALERQKRFGNTEMPGKLNGALPEKRERKRGREGGDEAADANKRGRPGAEPRRGSGRRENAPRAAAPTPRNNPQTGAGGYSDADKARMEVRKGRWA